MRRVILGFVLLLAYSAAVATQSSQNLTIDYKTAVWNQNTTARVDATAADGAFGTLNVNTVGAGCAVIWQTPSGTITGGQLAFDVTFNGGLTWTALSGSNGDYTFTQSDLSPASTAFNGMEAGWRFPVNTFSKIRVRLQSAITGSGTITVYLRSVSGSCTPFAVVRQGDATRLNAQVQGAVANGSAASATENPLKIGGVGYGVVGETQPALSNFPTPVAVSSQATMLLTQYNEPRVMQSDRYLDTTIAANGVSRVIATEGLGTLMVAMPSSTWTGTVLFEQSTDGVTYVAAAAIDTILSTYTVVAGQVCAGTCAGAWQVTTLQQGYRFFRVRSSAWTSGTATVRLLGYNTPRALVDFYYTPFVRQDHPARFSCSGDNIAASLTELSAGCAAATVGSTVSIYITDIVAQSTTTTGGPFAIRSGTGTNCGTNTANVFPNSVATARWSAASNNGPATAISFTTPIKVTADHGLCVIGTATNTTTIQINGWIAP